MAFAGGVYRGGELGYDFSETLAPPRTAAPCLPPSERAPIPARRRPLFSSTVALCGCRPKCHFPLPTAALSIACLSEL
uniref:Uncharacterized protein n=1 Tax=Arundo donax TaxID=35708 RepID=A0A0A9AI37_ARUDO